MQQDAGAPAAALQVRPAHRAGDRVVFVLAEPPIVTPCVVQLLVDVDVGVNIDQLAAVTIACHVLHGKCGRV